MSSAVEPDDMMTVVAARALRDETVCFVGIGLPSTAANLARLTHAPRTVLVYESGTIGSKPAALPLSIGDGELAETADAVVPVPEIFAYWLQGGRIDVGFLGAAQIDRFANLNSTVIGDYGSPKVRLPGGGGAPEIAALAREVIVIIRQSERTFVDQLHFRSSVGYGGGKGDRERLGMTRAGPRHSHHRPGHPTARPGDLRAHADRGPPRRVGGPGARGVRLGAAGGGRGRGERSAVGRRAARPRGAAGDSPDDGGLTGTDIGRKELW
jgi:glutaconate CoA-transferase, subunit B